MLPAATRLIALGVCSLLLGACSHAAKGAPPATPPGKPDPAPAVATKAAPVAPVRAAPARPAPPVPPALRTSLRVGGFDYVSATDLDVWLGWKGAWTEPLRKLTLTDKSDPANRAEIEADSRNATVNGLRVFLGDKAVVRAGHLYVSKIDAERCLAPLLRPGFGVALPAAPKIIVLDPGHGGVDPGTENKPLGLQEKIPALDVALRLRKLLETAGYKVVMTRTTDAPLSPVKSVDLERRPVLANRERADLFVSIHFNAVDSAAQSTRGTEIYTYAPRNQHATEWWSGLKKDDPDLLTEEQPANRFDHWNAVLAGVMHRELLQTLKTEDRGKKIKHLAVLKTLNCPGVLVEPAYVSNDVEGRRLLTPEFRQKIAEALAAGIRDYAAILDSLRPKPQPAAATMAPPAASISR